MSTTCWSVFRVSVAYMCRAGNVNCSASALYGVIAEMPVWMSALKRPSSSAPIATRCSVFVRPPTSR